jgi:flagellar motility protein MotE (MotC chaperone)
MVDQRRDRITITRPRAEGPRRPLIGWGKQIWSAGIWLGAIMALCWTMVQLNHASSAQTTALSGSRTALPVAVDSEGSSSRSVLPEQTKTAEPESSPPPSAQAQGPALNVPEEVVAMFQQRQEDLERREKAVRMAEERFTILRTEIEQILSKVEAAEQRHLRLKEQQEKVVAGQSAVQNKQAAELRNQNHAQLSKMYESMPAEEAAARIERMPDRKALEILRLLKGKTAGSILAQVKVDRAAKLTEQLLSNP